MGRQPVTDTQAGFAGGLNLTGDQALLRGDQCRLMRNARLQAYGAAMKRLGTVLTTASPITTIDTTNDAVGGIYWPKTALAWVFCASTTLSPVMHVYSSAYLLPTASTWSDRGVCPQYRPVIFSDGTNEVMYVAGIDSVAVQKITSAGAISALAGTTAQVRGLVVYNDRLWGWKGNSLYYSNLSSTVGSIGGDSLGDGTTGGGQIVVNTFGSSDIATCKVVNGVLEIHHTTGISTLTGWGQDDIQVKPQALNSILGPGWGQIQTGIDVADSAVVANELTSGDVCYFITSLGAYSSNGSTIKPLSTPEKPDPLQALLNAGSIGVAQISVTFNRRYNEVWFFVRGSSNVGGVYAYNVVLESWSGPYQGNYTSTRGPAFFTVLDGTGQAWLWRVDTTSGNTFVIESDSLMGSSAVPVYKDGVTANGTTTGTGGNPVTMTLQLHRMFGADRVFSKSWRWLNLLATLVTGGTPPTVSCTTDLGGTNTQTLSGLTSVETAYYVSPGGVGPFIDCTITDTITTGNSQYALATVQGNWLGQR